MSKNRIFNVGIILAILLFSVIPSFAADPPAQEVIATGFGSGDQIAAARDEAINDALRKAVEQGVGVNISSQTTVEQMVLIEDRIYSESRGFIESYKIINEGKEDDVYQVKISALVKMAELSEKLAAIGIILKKKENPRVMVIVHSRELTDSIIGFEAGGNANAENQLERILLQKGFRLVAPDQQNKRKDLAELLTSGDPSRAGKIAKDFGAEILIEAEVRREFAGNRSVLGQDIKFFTNEIRLKALEADTAKIIYSGYRTKPASGASALQVLEEATADLAKEMVDTILDQWRKDVYQASNYQLNISQVTFSKLAQIIENIKGLRGVSDLQTRNFQNNSAFLELKFQGGINDLAGKIGQIKNPALEITGLRANTIDLETKDR
ncbi:MAG: LPP20 family lipoprotein [Proteobacteria bacterium]|nr:LPP20 family lipoprotein [Pseudomonadota bacterium]